MTNTIFALYDEKTQAYFGVHESPTAGHAIRAFGDHVQNQNSPMSRHAGDYKLYKLGNLDPTSGLIGIEKQPVYLSCALDFTSKTLTPVSETLKSSPSTITK